jgi:AraC-like DNA-binding protein
VPQLAGPARDVPGLHTIDSLTAGAISVSKFTRGDGEVVWRHPQHRIVLPLTGVDARQVTVQFEGGKVKNFVWHDAVGFYPAGTQTRIVTTAATSLQLLWTPDPKTAGRLEPLLPFDDPLIATCSHAIARELDSGTPDQLFVESLGQAIVIKLMRHFSPAAAVEAPHTSGLSRERLRRLVEYVDAHLGDELTLDALAAVACLSPYHLSRSFRRAMGVGLHRYVVQRRIERARRLVLETDLSMAAIAWTVGFESQAAFTKRFRHEIGQTPSHLRRTN